MLKYRVSRPIPDGFLAPVSTDFEVDFGVSYEINQVLNQEFESLYTSLEHYQEDRINNFSLLKPVETNFRTLYLMFSKRCDQ